MDVLEEIQNLTPNKNIEKDKTTKDINEISINYAMTGKRWNQFNVVVDNIFSYNVSLKSEIEDFKPNLLKNINKENISLCGKKQFRQN